MVLSARERRALAGIERYLRDTDPRFARRMRRAPAAGVARTRAAWTVVAVVADLSALLCLALSLLWPAVAAALVGAVALHLRPRWVAVPAGSGSNGRPLDDR